MTSNQSAGESAPLAPSYIVQIDEIREHDSEKKYVDGDGLWWPSPEPGAIILFQGGASGTYWYCNGSQISQLPVGSTNGFPGCLQLYKAFSTFYVGGRGFRIMRGDATNPYPDESWHCLQFSHDGPHSLLTNVGDKTTLRYQQSSATWPAMLLPNIYHGKKTSAPDRGKLLGDLPIFLALVALSMPAQNLQSWLPEMFGTHIGGWRVHGLHAQWEDRRGVVVKVYQVPNNWPGASPREDLRKYEDGNFYGRHYYQY